jgi:spore coat polysaccharide biosynthesis protein SpsF
MKQQYSNGINNKGILITVRTGSTRLPNKATLKFGGSTTIEYLIGRLKKVKNDVNIILCTTTLDRDQILVDIANKHKISYFQGSEKDKLDRWLKACLKFDIDYFVTADGDDLFCDPKMIDLAFNQFENKNPDMIKSENIVCGAFTYGIKFSALAKVCEIKDSDDTEMMWHYFIDTGLFEVQELEGVDSKYFRDDIRLTLDYKEDLEFFKQIIKLSGNPKGFLGMEEILKICDNNPDLKNINLFRQSEFLENQAKNRKIKIKDKFSV